MLRPITFNECAPGRTRTEGAMYFVLTTIILPPGKDSDDDHYHACLAFCKPL